MSLERLGKQLAEEQDALRTARASDRAGVRERIAELPLRSSVQRRRARRWRQGAALAASFAAALLAWWPLFAWWQGRAATGRDAAPSRVAMPLAAMIEGSQQPVGAGAFVEAPARERLALRFSDGTRLQLSAGGRARVVELGASGAHVLLESGALHFDVVPRAHARWRMSAGPFLVRVTGTTFDLSWDPEHDRFALALTHGQVEVAGCVFAQGYRMRAGQRIHASCKRGQFEVAELRADARAATATASSAVPVQQAPVTPEGAVPPAPIAAAASADAADSFARRCATASAEQLVQWAEQARYAREFDREELALRALRRRFAGSPRAALAAFALGRLAFDVRGEHRKAARWFGSYVKEQPAGPLVREARGRLIEAALASGERERARSLARAYLEAHPDGPHAGLARTLSLASSP